MILRYHAWSDVTAEHVDVHKSDISYGVMKSLKLYV